MLRMLGTLACLRARTRLAVQLGWTATALALLALTGTAGALPAGSVSVTAATDVNLSNDSNKSCTEGPRAAYLGWTVRNTSGATLTDLYANFSFDQINIPTAGGVNPTGTFELAGGQVAQQYIGTLAPNEIRTVFWFTTYPCFQKNAPASARANIAVGTGMNDTNPVVSNFTVTARSAISAQAGGNISSTLLGPGAIVGQIIEYDVTYSFGNVSVGDIFNFQPAGNLSFDAGCLQLVGSVVRSTQITSVAVGARDTLFFVAAQSQGGSGFLVGMRYLFSYQCSGVSTRAYPYAMQTSGSDNLKYSGNYAQTGTAVTYPPFPAASNAFTVSKTASPAQLLTGGTVTYAVTVRNTSASYGAYLGSVTDALPTTPGVAAYGQLSSVVIDPASGPDPMTGTVVTYDTRLASQPTAGATGTMRFEGVPLKSLYVPPSGVLTITYTVTLPGTPGAYTNTAFATVGTSSTAPATATVRVGFVDLRLGMTDAAPSGFSAEFGGRYTLNVSNTGTLGTGGTTGTPAAFTVSVTLPAGVTLGSTGGAGWSCAAAATDPSRLTCTYAPGLAAGAAATALVLNVNVPGGLTGDLIAAATANGGPYEPATRLPDNTASVTVGHRDLSVTKASSTANPGVGSDITYTITLRGGTTAATNVVLTDVIPAGTTYRSAAVTAGSAATPAVNGAGTVVWTVPTLAAGVTETLTLTVRVTNFTAAITNTAGITSHPGTYDPAVSNNTGGVSSNAPADVSVQLAVLPASAGYVQVEESIRYTITITNAGPGSAHDVSPTMSIWSAGALLSVTRGGTAVAVQNDSGNLTFPALATLASGGSVEYTVTVRAPTATELTGGVSPTVPASVNVTTTTDPDLANNSANGVTRVLHVRLLKAVANCGAAGAGCPALFEDYAPSADGHPGEVLEYCIRVLNLGAVDVTNLNIVDPVPANTTARTSAYTPEGGTAPLGVKYVEGSTLWTSATDTDPGGLATHLNARLTSVRVGATATVCFQATIR